jgi:outer membrane protein TolC
MALEGNLSLENAARSLASSSSSRREAIAEFIPFVDLTASTEHTDSNRNRLRRSERLPARFDETETNFTRTRNEQTVTNTAGATARQNLPWGGDLSAVAERTRTDSQDRFFPERDEEGLPLTEYTESEEHNAELRLEYAQPLLKGAGWTVGTAALRQSRLGEMRQAIDFELRRRDVALSIIQRYYDVLRGQLDVDVSRAALREVDSFLQETRVRHELGLIPESEISRAEIRFLQEKQRFVQRQQRYESAIDTLLDEMGLPLNTRLALAPVEDQLVDLRLADLPPMEEAVGEALSNRIELLREDISVEDSTISLAVARNNILPTLDGTASWVGLQDDPIRYQSDDIEARRETSWGLNLLVPLPNIGARERAYRARLTLETAENDRRDQRRTIEQDVREAYRNLLASELSTRILARTVEQARRSLALENARYETGLNTSTEVRNAQDDLFQAQVDYNQSLLQMQVDISRVYRSLGRGIY